MHAFPADAHEGSCLLACLLACCGLWAVSFVDGWMAANTVLDGGRLGSVRGDLLNGGFFFPGGQRERGSEGGAGRME